MDKTSPLTLYHSHPWDVTPLEARAIQNSLKAFVLSTNQLSRKLTRVAGIDVGFEDQGRRTRAAIAVLSFPKLELLEVAIARRPTSFPYVPGLLSFREIPAVLEALAKLHDLPELLLCDGQGYAHPRRFGLACHLGVVTDIPSIGVGKTRLIGTYGKVPIERGGWAQLMSGEDVIGAVLTTRKGVKPIFVSIGHRISLATSVEWVMACTTRFKLPETTRWAHRFASGERQLPNTNGRTPVLR